MLFTSRSRYWSTIDLVWVFEPSQPQHWGLALLTPGNAIDMWDITQGGFPRHSVVTVPDARHAWAYHPLWDGIPAYISRLRWTATRICAHKEHTAPFFFEFSRVRGGKPPLFGFARLGFVAQLDTALFTRRYWGYHCCF